VKMAAPKLAELPTPRRDYWPSRGATLFERQRLSTSDVDRIDRYATEQRLRFGDAAVRLSLASQGDIESALAEQFKYPILRRGGANGVADDVIAAYDPKNEVVEPLRTLRSQLILRWRSACRGNVLAITSPDRGDGRSWLAANLATVFAQAGERTLLIDTDMRHPSQHRLFNLDNRPGLSALLTGRTGGREVLRLIHPRLKLRVLTAGILPPNPQELLVRPLFKGVLHRLSQLFDLIVLDTPAATETADAQILSARAGTAVILARRNRTCPADLSAAMANLVGSGVNVIGSVVTDH